MAIGGTLDTLSLVEAYGSGVFPWPEDDDLPILWFCPNPRGILRHKNLHISRSLKRAIKKGGFEVRIDTSFDDVIEQCSTSPRKGQMGTWITPNMKSAYRTLYREGFAHCVETWKDGTLVGGVYGVYVNNTFSGESMFHRVNDASKVALVALMNVLFTAGVQWIDTQMLTPVVASLGGELISRQGYIELLHKNREDDRIPWSRITDAL